MYLIAFIEHKSSVDYNVTMQVLRYMVYIWEIYEEYLLYQAKGAVEPLPFGS